MKYKLLALLCLTFSLGGCGPWLNDVFYKSDRLQERDWAAYGKRFNPPEVYCYKTLGSADCYGYPQPAREGQLIEYYLPPQPAPLLINDWWPPTECNIVRQETIIDMRPLPLTPANAEY